MIGSLTQITVMDNLWPSFNDFWNGYDKKIDRPKCEKKWGKLKQVDKEKIMNHIVLYVKSTPDKQFRKHPATYLNNRSWENEIINGATADKKRQHSCNLEASWVEAYGAILTGGKNGQGA